MCNHDKDIKNKQPLDSAFEHGDAHEKDHQKWSRRAFVRNVGIAGSLSMFLGKAPLTAMAKSPFGHIFNTDSDHILVMIRQKGGNDGLNMIVPVFDYGTYQSARPNIHIPQNELINLTAEQAMPNTMQSLDSMWQDGQMKVINSVGYANNNLSHFRSADIWASASDANVIDNSGWLGRFLDQEYPDFITNPPTTPPAIQIGGSGNILFENEADNNMGIIVSNPDQLYEIAQTGQLHDPLNVPDCHYGEQLSYLRTVANSTFTFAESISNAYNNAENAVEYNSGLGNQLALVARLIKGGLGTQFYVVTHDGYDTHAGQSGTHANLMRELSDEVKNFYDDLSAGGVDERVLSMTFSEFGRRIDQNASNGTDHGAAAPLLMFGPGLNGNGAVGALPDMQHVDGVGNLVYDIDFRRIYATVLENWLCADTELVDQALGQYFERIPELGLDCTSVGTKFTAKPNYDVKLMYGNDYVNVGYTLPKTMPVKVDVYDILGKHIKNLHQGYLPSGPQIHTFSASRSRMSAGIYLISIQIGNDMVTKKVRFVK